jgi:hypothetical protein
MSVRTTPKEFEVDRHDFRSTSTAEKLAAYCAAFAAGFTPSSIGGPRLALVVAIALLPVWIGEVFQRRIPRAMFLVVPFCVASGVCLALFASSGLRVNWVVHVNALLFFLYCMVAFGLLLWAAAMTSAGSMLAIYAMALLGTGLLTPQTDTASAWKYTFALPTTILFLVVASRTRKLWAAQGVLVLMAAVSLLAAYRSFTGFCVGVVVLTIVLQWMPKGGRAPSLKRKNRRRRRGTVQQTIIAALTAVLVYGLFSALALNGYLGDAIRTKSIEQTSTGVPLLAGGRPEWAATLELVKSRPFGFGPGVMPSSENILDAKLALLKLGVGIEGNYVNQYIFGHQLKLHSIMADLWASFGLAGLLLSFLMLVAVGRSLPRSIFEPAVALRLFMAVICAWFIFFGPILSNLPTVLWLLAGTLNLPASDRATPTTITQRGDRWAT